MLLATITTKESQLRRHRIKDMKRKDDYIKILFKLLEPLKRHYSNSGSMIELSGAGATYGADVIGFEAFARPLWGLVPYWKSRGEDDFFAPLYRKGIAEGTNPESEGYWGDCTDFDQRFVEMAALAFGLIAVPDVLWNPLSENEKKRVASWLYQINNHDFSKCNWLYFRVLVNKALSSLGMESDDELVKSDMALIESWYQNDGWYKDGVSGRADYYSAFAMMYYPLLLNGLGLMDDSILEKAKLFASDFIYWFTSDGAALPYGRSLTYRFAQAAFWSAAVFASVDIDISVAKGIISRNLDYWLGKDIFNGDGTLSVGYGYPNLSFAENYNAPGSPYWSFKVFLFLALDDNHPFWSVEEKELQKLDPVHRIDSARMLIQNSGWNATCYPLGNTNGKDLGHFVDKYFKFAYSTALPMCISHSEYSLEDAAPDSTIAFRLSDGFVAVRRNSINSELYDDGLYTESVVAEGIKVSTRITVGENYHIRRHEISVDRDCDVFDCGFAIPKDKNTTLTKSDDSISIANNGLCSKMTVLSGNAKATEINAVPNTSIMYRNVIIPALTLSLKKGDRITLETKVELF